MLQNTKLPTCLTWNCPRTQRSCSLSCQLQIINYVVDTFLIYSSRFITAHHVRAYSVVLLWYVGCPLVCPSVMLVDCDQIHRDSWKVISRINRVDLFLTWDPNITSSKNSKGNMSNSGWGTKKNMFSVCN